MSVVISTEGLGKKYILNHASTSERYRALRDVLAAGARNLANRISGRSPTRAHQASDEEFWALKDISFTVNRGDRIGIIGRNGAGKSTLLKILSRITEPTTGRIAIRGRVASLLEVGTGFHSELTGRENIYLNGAILGMSRAEIRRRFDEIVAFAEVERFLDTPVKRYSSGMYVRLAFAVAAHLEPEILIVDEVLAVGDAQFQKKCLGKMEEAGTEGRTILFVSHNMSTIQRLCRQCLLLERGALVMNGNTAQVVDAYLSNRDIDGEYAGDLTDLPRGGHLGEKVRLKRAILLNAKGERCESLMFGEGITLHIEATSMVPIAQASLIIGIDTYAGERITTIASEDNDEFFDLQTGHDLCVTVQVPHFFLKPGTYLVTLGIRQDKNGLDHLRNVLKIEVASACADVNLRSDTWGLVHAYANYLRGDSAAVL